MNILLALVPISLILLGLAIYAFVWAVRNGQYDDLDTPALDILTDSAAPSPRTQQHERIEARAEVANARADDGRDGDPRDVDGRDDA